MVFCMRNEKVLYMEYFFGLDKKNLLHIEGILGKIVHLQDFLLAEMW